MDGQRSSIAAAAPAPAPEPVAPPSEVSKSGGTLLWIGLPVVLLIVFYLAFRMMLRGK